MTSGPRVNDTHTHMHDHHMGCYKSISWSAVLVGAFVAVGLSFLLNLFGIAIGLSAFAMQPDGSANFTIGGFIGLAIVSIIAMFVSGWATGYLSRPVCPKRNLGILYGMTTWSVALILGIMLAGYMTSFVLSRSDFDVNPNNTVVRMHNNVNAPLVASRDTESGQQVTVSADKAANTLATGAYVTFFLFFLGAIATCFGAHCGLSACKRDDEV